MTVKLASLRANLDREAEGEWIEYPDWPGVAFNVRSLHTAAYTVARDLAMQKLNRRFKGKPAPNHEVNVALGRPLSEHILLGWRGLDETYSQDRAREVLTDPAFREVVDAVLWCGARVGEGEVEFVEETAKNSQSGSGTTSPAAPQTTS